MFNKLYRRLEVVVQKYQYGSTGLTLLKMRGKIETRGVGTFLYLGNEVSTTTRKITLSITSLRAQNKTISDHKIVRRTFPIAAAPLGDSSEFLGGGVVRLHHPFFFYRADNWPGPFQDHCKLRKIYFGYNKKLSEQFFPRWGEFIHFLLTSV